jgi:hypothetical protein
MKGPEADPDVLYVNATIDNDTPLVCWQYQGIAGILTVTEARDRAAVLFNVAAIAESEAAIAHGLMKAEPQSKGFGAQVQKQKSSQVDETIALTLRFIRDFRPPLPNGINAIFGLKTKQALIEILWYGHKLQVHSDSAKEHAIQLLEAAEAAESDAFFYHFLENKVGFSKEESYPLIQEFFLFRHRARFEKLFIEKG